MWIRHVFLGLAGLTAGAAVAGGTFAFLIILSLVGCAVSLTLGDYLRNMIRSSGFDVAGVHDKKSLEKKLQQLVLLYIWIRFF